jgi:Fe-S-cluster-containing hydrogenase component 2
METVKQVIKIDKEKCNGCGLCVQACINGFLRIYYSKAVPIKGAQCDGKGECIEECPQDAITLVPANFDSLQFTKKAMLGEVKDMILKRGFRILCLVAVIAACAALVMSVATPARVCA